MTEPTPTPEPQPATRTHRPCPNSPEHVHVNRYGRWECIPRRKAGQDG